MNLNRQIVEKILAEKGMTWSALAVASGISRQNISTVIRRGSCMPKTAGKLAIGLNVSVSEITTILEEEKT